MNPVTQETSTITLIETYAKRLNLSAIKKRYKEIVEDAVTRQISYEAFLLDLLTEEVSQKEASRFERTIKKAGFPSIKTLDQYDFNSIPSINKPRILRLAESGYIPKAKIFCF